MSIYVHHVGKVGADEDFPKTVIKRDGTLVRRNFKQLTAHMPELSPYAKNSFSDEVIKSKVKEFQIWGIPSGGERALCYLKNEDYFLLLPEQVSGSRITYAGRVISRAPEKSFQLSKYLWGNERYPIIFLMDGQAIDYGWEQLWSDLSFKANFQLRGKAIRVTDNRIAESHFGNQDELLKSIGLLIKPTTINKSNSDDDLQEDIISLFQDESLNITERNIFIKARLGQGKFRHSTLQRWQSQCAVTGCKTTEALRASHIKPWRSCSSKERLHSANGIILIANLDAMFDRYLITFDEHGQIIWSKEVDIKDRVLLAQKFKGLRCSIDETQEKYMKQHRDVFRSKNQ